MTDLQQQNSTESSGQHWGLKNAALIVPASIVPLLMRSRPVVGLEVGLVLGVIIQAFIPPRLSTVRTILLIVAIITFFFFVRHVPSPYTF